jgi:hypothetical protein
VGLEIGDVDLGVQRAEIEQRPYRGRGSRRDVSSGTVSESGRMSDGCMGSTYGIRIGSGARTAAHLAIHARHEDQRRERCEQQYPDNRPSERHILLAAFTDAERIGIMPPPSAAESHDRE